MVKRISLLINHDTHQFWVYGNQYDGTRKFHEFFPKDDAFGHNPWDVVYATLENYHGTVWVAHKWENGTFSCIIKGRWKDVKHLKDQGYEIKKIVLEEYEDVKTSI